MLAKSLIMLFLLSAICLVGCSNSSTSQDKQPEPVVSAGRPDSETAGARIYLYDRGELTMVIRADRINQYEDIDSTMGYVLDVDFYDSAGQITSTLVGDSGIIRENTGFLKVYSHVVVVSDDRKLETDSLVFNPAIDKIQTKAFVKISHPWGEESGWGLEAPRDLSSYKILSGASSGKMIIPDEAIEPPTSDKHR